jgi:hypothetical protein
MKDFKELITEVMGHFHPSHMTEEHYWEIRQALSDLTDSLRNAHDAVRKYQLEKELKLIETTYAKVAKATVAFANKYGKQFGANKLSGFRSL